MHQKLLMLWKFFFKDLVGIENFDETLKKLKEEIKNKKLMLPTFYPMTTSSLVWYPCSQALCLSCDVVSFEMKYICNIKENKNNKNCNVSKSLNTIRLNSYIIWNGECNSLKFTYNNGKEKKNSYDTIIIRLQMTTKNIF